MIVGYARVSTTDQEAGLQAQVRDLRSISALTFGVYEERASAVGERPVLDKILRDIKKDDTLVVTKLDRLARSVAHLGEIVAHLDKRGAYLRILNIQMDTKTPTGKMILNILGSVAQFERELMLERQREGIEVAKKAGKYRGAPRKVDYAALKLHVESQEVCKAEAVARTAQRFKVAERTVYRALGGR